MTVIFAFLWQFFFNPWDYEISKGLFSKFLNQSGLTGKTLMFKNYVLGYEVPLLMFWNYDPTWHILLEASRPTGEWGPPVGCVGH